tara:strand:+ start:13767 stop:14219 length:453 start_codon:yes stop_codon:yes gene_type:complete
MNQVKLAIWRTTHEYKGGKNGAFRELAALMVISEQVMRNKACPTSDNSHFSPEQLLTLQNLTDDYRVNNAMRLAEKRAGATERGVTESLLHITHELGSMAHIITEAEADGKYTEREKADCISQLNRIEKACEHLKLAIHQQEAGKLVRAV